MVDYAWRARQYAKQKRFRHRWYKLMMVLASVVVFCTTYALILPAITMEQQCQTPEHLHTDDCYTQVTMVQQVLSCPCDGEKIYIHQHDDACYDEDGILQCNLPEIKEHSHDERCYQQVLPTGEEAEEEAVLVCTDPEITYHAHDDSCYERREDENGNEEEILICEQTEVLSHQHDASCWKTVEVPTDTQTLTCQIAEHTHTDDCGVEDGFSQQEAPEASEDPVVDETTSEPLKINPTGATLFYKVKADDESSPDWKKVTEETTNIPGDASFKLEVNFTANVAQLKNAGYKMVYESLPEWFRNVKATDVVTDSDKKEVGTMTVEGGKVLLTFDPTWTGLNQETMEGSFFVEAEANLSSITDPDKTEITVGKTTIKVQFDGDLIAKYGDVTLEKAMGELKENDVDGFDYITYKLTAKAGADGCPDVKVTDSFTSGSQYVEEFILPEGSGATVENGTLTWTIGNMGPNETKELTYQVKLKQNYLGANPKDEALANLATLYSKDYQRTSDSQSFEPKGKATMSKIAGEFTPNESGGGTIQYTVWVHADKDNNYTLENVTIWDSLDGSIESNYKTEEKFLKYISYDENSFKYYIGGSEKQNGPGDLLPTETTEKPSFVENKKSFYYNVGNLEPGDDRLLIYEVKVDAGVFTQSNEDFQINNRVYIITDPKREGDGGKRMESYLQSKTITTKKWARKLLGEQVTEETTIKVDDKKSFTVPVGSQQYQVVVNETGDWDVSSAVMKDNLHSEHMVYVGYVRVDAIAASNQTNYGSDAAAAAVLGNLKPVQTAWVKIDGETSFEFTPKDIGLPEGKCAYLLTYYAKPQNMEGYSTVIVANEFNLTGTVGNGNTYTLGGIQVSASVQLEGSNHFGAQKCFWYYDANADVEGQNHGALYWVLKLSGETIPKGTMLLDAINEGPHKVGTVEKAFFADCNLEFSDERTVDSLTGTDFTTYGYEVTTQGLELTLTEDVKPNGQCLYFVVSTYPTSVPQENGKSQVYKNALSIKDPGEGKEWTKVSEDQTYVVAGDNLYKSMVEVFKVEAGDTLDETTIKYVNGDEKTILQKDYLWKSGSGVYVAWRVYVNHTATLNGGFRVHEKIPGGMDVVYVQRYSTYLHRDVKFQEIDGLGDAWKKIEQEFTYQDGNPTPAIYYVNGQDIIWEFEEKDPNPNEPGSRYVDYLVVCKVTDSDLFLSGEEKTYINEVTLLNTDGKELGKGSADVALQVPMLGKKGTYSEDINGGRYPFEIQLNELGDDLVPGADTIKLIDEMGEDLILDPSSIKVVKTGTEEAVPFTSAIEGQKLMLTLPDDQPLTITYEAAINAAPGQSITITNNAHWEGYTTTPGGSVKVDSFSYSVGATVDTSTKPELTISKVDQYDTGTKLSGAKFTLTEMEWTDSGFVKKSDGLTLNGTTDENGSLIFGAGEENLKCNVPYQLVETNAPEGYVLDATAQYFVFALKENNEYPAILETYKSAGAYILYSTHYTHTVLNHKGEITVEKLFQNADGSSLGKVDGTYTFGLFEKDSETCLQKATIQWANGTVTPEGGMARFTNVELDKTYVVYELDDTGQPVKTSGGSATVGRIPFLVTYEKNTVTINAGSPTEQVTVTNRVNYPELPNTGGPGTQLYQMDGAALTAAALWLMYHHRKRRKEGSIPS